MEHFGKKSNCSLITMLFLGLSCVNTSLQSVTATSSEWPLGLPENYTTAYLNMTYNSTNGSFVNEISETGRFIMGAKIVSVSGVVIHVNSIKNGTIIHYGSDPITNKPKEEWIALIKREMCDFELKLENAYAHKAVGIIVYDVDRNDSLEDMKLFADTIPVIFTYKSEGERIANLTDGDTRVFMNITVGQKCSKGKCANDGNIFWKIFKFMWAFIYFCDTQTLLNSLDEAWQERRRGCRGSNTKKALAKTPTRSIEQTDKVVSGEGESCVICWELYTAGDMLRTLPCRHEFHKECVDPWLLEHQPTCPLCRMGILENPGCPVISLFNRIFNRSTRDNNQNRRSNSVP
ncbi:unnamed protein product [Orchesella dallaii]|uniref:RING-type domain-containing protein n=1 Tax=Orchesella dallaii TaxID=48710 RepID=A0ABP1RX16_9HEXA